MFCLGLVRVIDGILNGVCVSHLPTHIVFVRGLSVRPDRVRAEHVRSSLHVL